MKQRNLEKLDSGNLMLSVVNISSWASPNMYSNFNGNIATKIEKLIEE